MNRKILPLLIVFLLSFSSLYCQKFPFGKLKKGASLVGGATREVSEEEEYFIGRAVAANILSQFNLLKDQAFSGYLNTLGSTLAFRSQRPEVYGGYHFALLDSDEANALSAPGGVIFITKGLLRITSTEDELAAVIAHEIAHIVAKDPLKAIRSERVKQLGAFTAGEVMESQGASGNMMDLFQNSILDITGTLLQKGYSRGQEKDADLAAIGLLRETGYDPSALLSVLKKIEEASGKPKAKVLSAHPPAKEREKYVQKALEGENPQIEQPERRQRYSNAKRALGL